MVFFLPDGWESKLVHRSHRLERKKYLGRIKVAFTICCSLNKLLLSNESVLGEVNRQLYSVGRKQNICLIIFLVMPNHIHLIIEGKDESSDLLKFINSFKQKTAFWYKQKFGIKLWQSSYYDQIIKDKKMLQNYIRYIINNPKKAGIKNFYNEKKSYGSQTLNIPEIIKKLNNPTYRRPSPSGLGEK